MSKEEMTIPIFFAVDDEYIPFFAVALESLIENASKKYVYEIKILYTNISEYNKSKVKKEFEKENVSIDFVNLNSYIDKMQDKFYTRDYYSHATYYRMFIPDLYPQYEKAIYLDSDITVIGDISELYNIDMEDYLIIAVPDGVIQATPIFQEYVEKVVGVSDYKMYFNAGVLVMNLEELRNFKFQEKFIYLLETVKFAVAQDQDYLNKLCKGKTKYINGTWNTMPGGIEEETEENLKIIHYNLSYKPWHFDNIMYQDYFWHYAAKTEYYEEILRIKNEYTEEERKRDLVSGENLLKLAKKEAECVGDDRMKTKEKKKSNVEKSPERLEVLKRIEKLEKEGKFDIDAENDPPSEMLMPDSIDYLRKGSYKKLKTALAYKIGERFLNDLLKNDKLLIKEVRGIENFDKVKTGALITCNHFNPFDCFAVESTFRMTENSKNKKFYKVIREGNYTNFPGLYGFFFRNCDTLPLSSNTRTMVKFMKAVDTILKRGDFVLIYPEQSLWWNYRKPKPLKNGAFKLASRSNVPVIPVFITMEDSSIIGEDGFPVQEYTINIEEPIYPNPKLTEGENTQNLKEKNFEIWKNIYEVFYGIPLVYTTENETVKLD